MTRDFVLQAEVTLIDFLYSQVAVTCLSYADAWA